MFLKKNDWNLEKISGWNFWMIFGMILCRNSNRNPFKNSWKIKERTRNSSEGMFGRISKGISVSILTWIPSKTFEKKNLKEIREESVVELRVETLVKSRRNCWKKDFFDGFQEEDEMEPMRMLEKKNGIIFWKKFWEDVMIIFQVEDLENFRKLWPKGRYSWMNSSSKTFPVAQMFYKNMQLLYDWWRVWLHMFSGTFVLLWNESLRDLLDSSMEEFQKKFLEFWKKFLSESLEKDRKIPLG